LGYVITALDHRLPATLLHVAAASLLPWVAWWGWNQTQLLAAGVWPAWDYRAALAFRALVLVVGFPLSVMLVGSRRRPPGAWSVSP
jgi:hypothetical protein